MCTIYCNSLKKFQINKPANLLSRTSQRGAHPKKKASRPSVKRRRRFVDVSEATVSTFFLSKVRIDDAAYIEIIDIGLKL